MLYDFGIGGGGREVSEIVSELLLFTSPTTSLGGVITGPMTSLGGVIPIPSCM